MKLFEITQLNNWDVFQDILFQRKKIWLYGMQYWYFKLTDINHKRVLSYILVKNRINTLLNNKSYCLKENEYILVETDFLAQKQNIAIVKPSWNKNILSTPSFSFLLKKDGLSITHQEHQIFFNEISADSYRANVFNVYQSHNLNTKNSKYYVTIQNIIKQGPLGPWHWLHLHLQDGTFVSLFLIMGTFNRVMWVGNEIWRLETVSYKNNKITYKASKQDNFLHVEIKKKYVADLVYKPKRSPAWLYRQVEVSVEAITTNVPELKEMNSGVGILELTEGICW